MSHQLDAKFLELRLFVNATWSNIALVYKLTELYPLLPKNDQTVRRNFSSAVRAARYSGDTKLIDRKINRLYRSARGLS